MKTSLPYPVSTRGQSPNSPVMSPSPSVLLERASLDLGGQGEGAGAAGTAVTPERRSETKWHIL